MTCHFLASYTIPYYLAIDSLSICSIKSLANSSSYYISVSHYQLGRCFCDCICNERLGMSLWSCNQLKNVWKFSSDRAIWGNFFSPVGTTFTARCNILNNAQCSWKLLIRSTHWPQFRGCFLPSEWSRLTKPWVLSNKVTQPRWVINGRCELWLTVPHHHQFKVIFPWVKTVSQKCHSSMPHVSVW